MSEQERVRVFIGSGEASLLERKVAAYSLRKHTKRDLDIYVFNGTHNAVELNDGEPFSAPMSLRVKYRNVTEFSLYRYLIPELCGQQGRAIYIDSDTICLTDIGELFDAAMDGAHFLAKSEAYDVGLWGLSVLLIDCETCRFDLETVVDEIDAGLYTMNDFSCMSPQFLSHHPYRIGQLDPRWNSFDQADGATKLIHYTNLYTQPWKYTGHPHGDLWFEYFEEARAAGYVTPRDIELSLVRSYVRLDLLKGNNPTPAPQPSRLRRLARPVKQALKGLVSNRDAA
jgi:glycosyl transferase family 8